MPIVKPLSALQVPVSGGTEELLRNRFLCRGGALMLVGPTGVGKSSLVMQMLLHWGLGREIFGITPARPLKSLLIQAENDEGDLAEMRTGVLAGMSLLANEEQRAMAQILCATENERSGKEFCEMLDHLVGEHEPDLVVVDPVFAYLGGDASSQRDVSTFLRNQINPILSSHQCGLILVHHTNKPPTGREKPNWQGGDFAYSGSGSAEFANWARAVLSLQASGNRKEFTLNAGKRGAHIGWRNDDGDTIFEKYIRHSTVAGRICWEEIDPSDRVSNGATTPSATETNMERILNLVPEDTAMPKDEVLHRVRDLTPPIGQNQASKLIDTLINNGRLYRWTQPRSGTRPAVLVARFPQSQGNTPQPQR